jgi:hypothetical protein
MQPEDRPITDADRNAIHHAATLAREQLACAERIAAEARPMLPYDSVLVASLVQAIASNLASYRAS